MACAAFVALVLIVAVPTCEAGRDLHAARSHFEAAAARYTREVRETEHVTPGTQAEMDRARREYAAAVLRWERWNWLKP